MPADIATPSQAAQPARKILVVEDTAICREPIISALKLDGFQVTGAADGQEAIDLIGSARPDLMLLDLEMPRMDGWTVLRLIRDHADHAELPVILLTATVDKECVARARALGVREYLLKGQF